MCFRCFYFTFFVDSVIYCSTYGSSGKQPNIVIFWMAFALRKWNDADKRKYLWQRKSGKSWNGLAYSIISECLQRLMELVFERIEQLKSTNAPKANITEWIIDLIKTAQLQTRNMVLSSWTRELLEPFAAFIGAKQSVWRWHSMAHRINIKVKILFLSLCTNVLDIQSKNRHWR